MEVAARPAQAALEVEERAGMQGPHVSDMRERKPHWRNTQSKRGKHNSVSVPKALRPRELGGRWRPAKQGRPT
jgi:hypothetical protein